MPCVFLMKNGRDEALVTPNCFVCTVYVLHRRCSVRSVMCSMWICGICVCQVVCMYFIVPIFMYNTYCVSVFSVLRYLFCVLCFCVVIL